jgi:23S rRNA (pseudouridine1915-N3)-methyltransferase
MKMQLIAVGHIKGQPTSDLFEMYKKRLTFPFSVREITLRGSSGKNLKDEEGRKIIDLLPEAAHIILLDERGEEMTSKSFATYVQACQMNREKALCFVIGGADGLSDSLKNKAHKVISFGKATWPHMLVRVMLVEQIYRAQQILSNHPYHRE